MLIVGNSRYWILQLFFYINKKTITESAGKLARNSIFGLRETKGKERRRWFGQKGS